MKHPNKKIEAIRKEYAWALMSRKKTKARLVEYYLAELDRRRNGKTIPMELNEL
jgi:hypothetical protein